nr:hypothetical protein GCM10025732_28050 [Glycomyces mayteni]
MSWEVSVSEAGRARRGARPAARVLPGGLRDDPVEDLACVGDGLGDVGVLVGEDLLHDGVEGGVRLLGARRGSAMSGSVEEV